MSRRTERGIITAIVAIFTLLGSIYSVVTPVFEASDEKWHYPMVKTIADNWSLPVQELGVDTPGVEATPWRQEGSQAPLYYVLSAVATFWIDTSDMDAVRHLNPHVDSGATPDGNVNLVVHDPALERFPWQGTVLAVHIIRFLSVLMGAAAVILTYLIAREVLPDRPTAALGAAAIHAFTPMVIFISGSVNNDNLAVLLSSLGLWMLVKIANPQIRKSPIAYRVSRIAHCSPTPSLPRSLAPLFLMGIVLGLAALTKSQTLALAPLTALVVFVRAWRQYAKTSLFRRIGLAIGHCSLVILPALAVSGWWYLRNLRLYGDLTGIEMFTQILGKRDVPAGLDQLWRERFSFFAGYWGNFGGINVPMPTWTYSVLNTVVPIAALGLVVATIKYQISNRKSQDSHLIFDICNLPFILCLLWALLVFVPWLLWARITWSSQGRLVFYAISVWSLLLAMGLAGWLPRRWGKWAVAAFALFLLGLAAAAPFAWIAPTYALPKPLTDAQVAAIPNRLDADFGGAMRLLGYDLGTESVEPGGQVATTLYWEALAPTDQDYFAFVHLLGKEERLVAQRDTFPGLGLLSTTWLEPGYRWADRYVIRVSETAYTPDEAQVEVGLYNASGRLPTSSGGDNVRFGRVELRPRQGDVPNPISINFDDQMELIGYDLDRLAARPGEPVTLTLHWRGLREMERNYTISAQLVGEGQVKAAEDSNWPLRGDAPTMLWKPGNLLEDPKTLVVRADAPPGVYDVHVTVFKKQDEEFIHLPVISDRGEMLSNHIVLTKVRVKP
jgi:hypothetical protein